MGNKEIIMRLARKSGVVSTRDVRSLGVHHEYLSRLCKEGVLTRSGRGLYVFTDAKVTANHGLVQVSKVASSGVICLLSALRFHEIGTQIPREVWVAVDRRSARPLIKHIKVRILRFSGKSMEEGIEGHILEGVTVRIYSPAKTVVDCFKYRNKIGLDVAIEALREALRKRKCSHDELWKYSKICRVSEVMRPYMEAVT